MMARMKHAPSFKTIFSRIASCKHKDFLFVACSCILFCMFVTSEGIAEPTSSTTKTAVIASVDDHYNTIQSISYDGSSGSFDQHIIASITSKHKFIDQGQQYNLFFQGAIDYPSSSQPTTARSKETVVVRNRNGKLSSSQQSLLHSILVMNDGVDWAVSHSLPENKAIQIPVELGNGVTSHITMTFDLEPIQIGATEDTKLVTVKTKSRTISGITGLFECSYSSIFIYSPKADELYQSTSIFVAKKGSEVLRIEELTYMTGADGETAKYRVIDASNRIGKLSSNRNDVAMKHAPDPWIIEALSARDSLYCATKAIAYKKTNWVYISAFIADATYSLMDYAWFSVAGETLVASITKANPKIGLRLMQYEVTGATCVPSEMLANNLIDFSQTPETVAVAQHAEIVQVVPDKPKPRVVKKAVPPPPGSDWLLTSLAVGGAIVGASAASGGSSGGGGGGECAGFDLADNYTADVTSPCMGEVGQDITFDLSLNGSCTVTGTASVFGGAPIAVDATNWSYAGGTLSIGSYSGAVAESANTFTTPLEQIFPAVADTILSLVDLLPPAEIQDIVDNCGTVENYVSNLTMTWTKE
jgi:hypothetical protein